MKASYNLWAQSTNKPKDLILSFLRVLFLFLIIIKQMFWLPQNTVVNVLSHDCKYYYLFFGGFPTNLTLQPHLSHYPSFHLCFFHIFFFHYIINKIPFVFPRYFLAIIYTLTLFSILPQKLLLPELPFLPQIIIPRFSMTHRWISWMFNNKKISQF